MIFGYRINAFGPPTPFKSDSRLLIAPLTRRSVDEPDHPNCQVVDLSADEEYRSVEALARRYPYQVPAGA